MDLRSRRKLFLLLIIANLTGIFVQLLMGDSALYANISKQMVLTGDYSNLSVNGADWLDKPHLQFWFAALMMEFLGIHDWVFKLSSFLVFLFGIRYTFLFAKRHYTEEHAWAAVIILSSSLHIIISNSDVRAENILLTFIIGAVYHFCNYLSSDSWRQLIFASVLAALAIMTKGLFALIPIGAAVLAFAMGKGLLKQLFHWKILVSAVLILLCISPELISLYRQFDMHPEKTVYGVQNVSGIKFFLWDSQFGRFFNTGPIKGAGHPTFFLQVMFWAFAPWGLLFYMAFAKKALRTIVGQYYKEWASLFGFLLLFVIYSLSSFQLSHYLNILFPFAAILSADYLLTVIRSGKESWFWPVHYLSLALLYTAMIAFLFLFELSNTWIFGACLLFCIFLHLIVWGATWDKEWKLLSHSSIVMALVAVFLNLNLYPTLFPYQSGTTAAITNNKAPLENAAIARNSFLLEFYSDSTLTRIDTSMNFSQQLRNQELVYADQRVLRILDKRGEKYRIVNELDHFHTTKLNAKFLDPETRGEEAFHRYLIEMID